MVYTTAAYGIPAPDDADARGAGAKTMRDMADHLAGMFGDLDTRATKDQTIHAGANGAPVLAAGTSAYLAFSAVGNPGDFTIESDPNLVRYTGTRGRWFLVSTAALFTAQGTTGAISWVAQLRWQGQVVEGDSFSLVDVGGAYPTAMQVRLGIVVPIYLSPGDALQLEVSTGSGRAAQVGGQYLRVGPMGLAT